MNSNKGGKSETLETQIAIIGGGGGLAGAVAAAEMGASVTVLEKLRKTGGQSAGAHGLFAAESPAQKRLFVDAQRDTMFKIAVRFARWNINPRIVRAYIDKSGDTIRWLEEKGVEFDVRPYFPNQTPMVYHIPFEKGTHSPKVGGEGNSIMKMLSQNCQDLGVQVLCETAVKKILLDDNGAATGVLATNKSGEELRIRAKAVIIATGGYGQNQELLKKYVPYYHENVLAVGWPDYGMGDGLLMAMEIGAATEGLGICDLEAAGHVKDEPEALTNVCQQPITIWVNKRGERFFDEAFIHEVNMFEGGYAVTRQPDSIAYAIIDEKIKQYLMEVGTIRGWRRPGGLPGTKLTNLSQQLESAKSENVKISSSLDEIAKWIGASPETLKTTIDEYNSFCDKGHDDFLAKDRRYLMAIRNAPYYAIKHHARQPGTVGGIKINHKMEVLNIEDNPIPGVYASGIDTGGWEPDVYNFVLTGSLFSFALNSARIAGENAAKYVLESKVS